MKALKATLFPVRNISEACKWGIEHEEDAIKKYAQQQNVTVTKCGFFINPKWPWLGCSPDGIISSSKAIEVKCPFTKKDISVTDACEKLFFMHLVENIPKLKTNHNYFYQCQGIMAITEPTEIDFVVYTNKSLHIETIKFQRDKWHLEILPLLTKFYFEFVAPETLNN